MPQATTSRKMRCRDCNCVVSPLSAYWFNVDGKRMSKPRCRDCHEQVVRRSAVKSTVGAKPVHPLCIFLDQDRYQRNRNGEE